MTKETFATWWNLFAQRWGKASSPELTAFYWSELQRMDDESFSVAARRALRSLEFFPTPEQLEQLGGVEAGRSPLAEWEKVLRLLRNSAAPLTALDGPAQRAVRAMGGLFSIGRSEADLHFRRSEFLELYERYCGTDPEPLPELTDAGRAVIARAMGGAGAKMLSGAEAPARQPAARS